MVGEDRPIGVAVVGFGWMGEVHTRAYTRVCHHFPDLPVTPVLVSVAEAEPTRAAAAVRRYGFARAVDDWHDLLSDSDIEAVSITAPNYMHREIGVAMARAGKHVWIEKPVGLATDDAEQVAQAVAQAGVQGTVGFNYRLVPAVACARQLIESDEIGTITHARVRLFADYAAHPLGALSWRFARERGGNGVLGDLASHGVDLIRFLIGEIDRVVADTATFISTRPQPREATSHYAVIDDGEFGDVENEDYVSALIQAGGARVVLEACRVCVAEQCTYGFEIHGTKGALFWDFRRMGELGVSTGDAYQNQAVSTVYVGPQHGEFGAFQPGAGLAMGYDDLKVIEAAHFLRSMTERKPHGTTIEDAVRSAHVLGAMTESVQTGRWVEVSPASTSPCGRMPRR